MITAIDHVQLAMPANQEMKAREFYVGLLGMTEMDKPAALAKRGGAWFAVGEVQVHLGVEKEFLPAKKAHPAFRVGNSNLLRSDLSGAGYPIWDDDAIPETKRFYTEDCFGNRIEFICQD